MKLHAIVLRILITLSLAAVVMVNYYGGSMTDSVWYWGSWTGYLICAVCLYLPRPTPRLFGAGGIAALMLGIALTALHGLTNFYPFTPPWPLYQMQTQFIFQSALGLFATAGSLALLYWEVQQLQKAADARRVDPEEEEFSRSAGWDEGPKKDE